MVNGQYGLLIAVDSWKDAPLNLDMHTLAFLPNVGWLEMTVIGVVLLLLFGRRLPEVGRSLGQGIVEFKKGLKDVTDDIKTETSDSNGGAQFDTARPPKNPDMLSSAHTTSTPMGEKMPVNESNGDA
jgi:sec-independent protein translocase protein TatA